MKTKYIILTISILFSICKPTQAQNDAGSFFDGLQETLIEAASNSTNPAVRDKLRKFMLGKGDIQMWMIANLVDKNHRDAAREDLPLDIYAYKSDGKDEIYGEFDWDNKALSMRVSGTSDTEYYLGTKSKHGDHLFTDKASGTHMQYTDKDGYWYVPYDDPNGEIEYIKFDAKQTAQGALEAGQDLLMEIWLNDTATQLLGLAELFTSDAWLYHLKGVVADPDVLVKKQKEILDELETLGDKTTYNKLEKIKEALKVLYDEKMAETVGFPVFIHWALMYSPDYIRAREDVKTEKYDCNGIKNGCTKLTVTSSGENKDKYMEFDQYDRLTYINSLKEGTVRFAYGKDLTVNLPPAITLGSIIGGIEEANAKSENDKKRWESYFEAQALKKVVENKREKERLRKEELERLRNEELEKLEEQLKEAVTPKEREKLQKKIKELKELMEKENKN